MALQTFISVLVFWSAFSALHARPIWALNEGTSAAPAQSSNPAPSQDDRKKGASKASAMALAQAAMAQVMCLKMMADAQKENDSEKMAMAAAMCAQAAALAANGKENEEGAKKSSSNSQMGPVPSFDKAKIETDPKPDVALDLPDSEVSKPSTIQLAQSPALSQPNQKPENEGSVFSEEKNFKNSPMGSPLSDMKDIDSSRIALSNNSNSAGFGNGTMGFGSSGTGGSLGSSSALSPFSLGASKEGTNLEDAKLNSKKPSKTVSGNGAEAGSGGFDDMMARYMGSSGGFGGFAGGANGGVLDLVYGLQKSGKPTLNIFEFASQEYQRAEKRGAFREKPRAYPNLIRAVGSQ